ncbi:MAG: IS1595 family transposase [Alphaproteobacteria bacterium]|nr:IS1595 family transposase [Alphaproteobacteria bacterium]MCZ6814166.1 IS1595 family transposase [Alphaproteobacteria bacterium]
MSVLDAPYFTDPDAAREHLEQIRWPDGPYCPHCGGTEKIAKIGGKKHRPGLYRCNDCRGHFTVTVGTVFERSKIPLNKWFLATYLLCSSKKGISSHQLHRTLGVTYKTAWFITHRIRESMRDNDPAPMGGSGSAVEVDETFIGRDKTRKPKGQKKGRGTWHMNKVLSLVDRGTGQARSMVIKDLKTTTIYPIVRQNVRRESRLMTDDAHHYRNLGKEFAQHGVVRHSAGQYVQRRDRTIHTQTIEGFFSIFKRGMRGIYQHCGSQHLHRYLAEFDFRYNRREISDIERTFEAMKGIESKRLFYRAPASS